MVHRSILAAAVLLLPLPSMAQQQGSPQAADKPGAIKGRVVAADTGAGLRRARVMLRGSESRPGMNPQTSQTNENGDYEIKEVKPGRYTLVVMRNGYVSQTYGQKSADPCPGHKALTHHPGGETSARSTFR
jgi:hypothetical protein